MKQNWKLLACLMLALGAPGITLAQSNLILPKNLDDIRQLTKEENVGDRKSTRLNSSHT